MAFVEFEMLNRLWRRTILIQHTLKSVSAVDNHDQIETCLHEANGENHHQGVLLSFRQVDLIQ